MYFSLFRYLRISHTSTILIACLSHPNLSNFCVPVPSQIQDIFLTDMHTYVSPTEFI